MKSKCKHEFFLEEEYRTITSDNSNDQCTDIRWVDHKIFRCKFCLHKVDEKENGKRYDLYRNNR